MASKQNDLMLNILANPQMSLGDFLSVGLSAKNTSLEDENTYLNSKTITENPLFQNASGEFDKTKFHNVYLLAAAGLEQMGKEPQDYGAVYSKYNIFAPASRIDTSPSFELVKASNPDRITKSMITLGLDGPREYTPLEIAQSQQIWNSEKLEWMDTPEDLFSFDKLFNNFTGFFSDNFGSTKVMATYDEDVDINGKKRGEVGFDESLIEHQKGDYMLNDNGTYYYRTLKDGENIYGKLILHYSDILTREGSALNAVDFLDSDDILKSPFGSFVKNASLIGAMFLPYVGTAIAGATIFQQAAGLGATLGKIALQDNTNDTLNWLEGLVESTNPINTRSEWSSIDYGNTGRNTTWTIENLLGMVGDVVGQLKQQRLLFEYAPYITKGKWGMMDPKKQKTLEEAYFNELQLASKGKVLSKLELNDLTKAIEASKKLEAANLLKAASMVEDYMKSYLKAGEELSKAYMTMLTVNDIYSEALEAGADDFDASLVTAGYAAMEYWLLSTDIGKWVLPELRGERLLNKAMLHALTKDVKDSFAALRKAAGSSDEARKTYLLKLVDFGKSVAKGEFNAGLGKKAAFEGGSGLLKAGVGSLMAGASAEAIEETSEELLGDFARVLFNGLEQFKGKDVRLKPFENVVDRYGMSFLGGFIGGGVSSAAFDFSNAKRALNMSYDEAVQQLIYKAHNNDLDGIYKLLDKEEVGNKNLSARKFDKDAEGNIIWKLGDAEDNLDLAIKNVVRRELSLIQNTLDAHGGKTDDELLDINTMRDLRYRALRNTTTAGLFIQKYNETLTELIKQTQELRSLNTPISKAENGEHDLKDSENPDVEAQRKKLEENIKLLDEKLEEFHSGAKAPLFIATALIESTPFIAQSLMAIDFKTFVKIKTGKDLDKVSKAELENLETYYLNYLRTDRKDDLQMATKYYLIMSALLKLNLEAVQEALKSQLSDSLISKLLSNTSEVFNGLNFELDSEKWLESFGKWAESATGFGEGIADEVNLLYNSYKENIANNLKLVDSIKTALSNIQLKKQSIEEVLANKIKDIETDFQNLGELATSSAESIALRDNSIKLANKEAEDARIAVEAEEQLYLKEVSNKGFDINNLDKQLNEANKKNKENLDKSLQDLIFKTGVQLAHKLADTILSQGFINGAIKDQVIDKLVSMSKTLEQAYKLADQLLLQSLINQGIDATSIRDLIKLGNTQDLQTFIEMGEYSQEDVDKVLQETEKLKNQYLIPKQELDNKIEQIKKLQYSPIMDNLDNFALNIGKRKVSKIFSDLGKILSSTRLNVNQFTVTGDLYKLIGEAEHILDLYIATLEGARVDTVDPFRINVNDDGTVTDTSNIWGINRVINEVHSKSPKVENELWEDLPEIEGEIADMMLEDAKRLKNLLHNYKQLYSINQGQKLNVQKRVSTKTHYLLYSRLRRLVNCELPDKEELERTLDSLTFLKELTKETDTSKWNTNLSNELQKQLEKERIQMEDAIYDYFKDKINDIDTLKKIFNPTNFVLHDDNPTLLSEGSENIDDSSFVGYLAAKAALKSSGFLSKLKDIHKEGTIAPLIGQEISVLLGLANILNGSAITNVIKAYRSSLLDMGVEERKQFLTKAGRSERTIKAYSTKEGFKLFVNDDLVPQYDNITFIDGIPGSGKSAAVDALIYKYLKAYHTDLANSVWVSHGGDTEGGNITKEFAARIGLGESFESAFDKKQILKNIFPEYETPKVGPNGNYQYSDKDYTIDKNGNILVKWEIDNKWTKDNTPKIIFIDEAQQFSQIELLAIDKFAKKFGISVVMSGDLSQSQMKADINISNIINKINEEADEEVLDPKNPLDVHLTRNQVLHTPKLGISMRTSNNLKNTNMANTEVVMGTGSGNLELHYFEDEKTIAGDYLLKEYDIEKVKVWIDKMIPLLKEGEKIHFAVPSKGDEFATKLKAIEKYNKVILFHEGVALGQEGQFWIVKFALTDVNTPGFKLDFYTGQTRSLQFSLMICPETVADGSIKIFNVPDQETHPEEYNPAAIKKYSEDYVKLLLEALPKDIEDIEYKGRNLEEEKPIEHSTSHPAPETTPSLAAEERREKRRKLILATEGVLGLEETSKEPTSETSSTEEPTATTEEPSTEEPNEGSDDNSEEPEVEVEPEVPTPPDGGPSSGGAVAPISRENQYLSKTYFLIKINAVNTVEELKDLIHLIDENYDNKNLSDEDYVKIQEALISKVKILDPEEKYFYIIDELEDSNDLEESDKVKEDEISPLEDLSVEEAQDKLIDTNGVITEKESQPAPTVGEFDLQGFRYTLYSNSSFELGTALLDDNNGTYEIEDQYEGLRIDGVNGIESGVTNGVITDPEWINIQRTKNIAEAERKLGYIGRLLKSQFLNKALIASLIAQDMGLSGGVYIRYAIKTSSFDINFEDYSRGFLKLEKSAEEKTRHTRALFEANSDSNRVNNRRLVAIIGTNGNDVIELPLLLLNNPITVIRDLDEEHPIRVMFENVFRDTNGSDGTKQIAALKAIKSYTDRNQGYQGLNDLITLYLNTYRHITFITDLNWTPGQNLEGLGLQLYRRRGLKNYDVTDYKQTKVYNKLDELRQDPNIHRITAPMHLNIKNGIIYDESGENFVRIANPKHPFVLYTDQTHNHEGQPITNDEDVMQEFIWQLFHDVPKTVQLIYILPPLFTFEQYMKLLVNFMVNKGPAPYGNQRTPYKILEAIFMADEENRFENVLNCFLNALGKEDGKILFDKTLSVIKTLCRYTNSEGDPDIEKLVYELTNNTEPWDLGNVGIPKNIPLYRQLLNVLKQLVNPQSVVMQEGEDGMQMYTSRKGIDKMDTLLGPLEELFNKSKAVLYHQTVGSKLSSNRIFVTILTDANGHFTNGEDFTLNGNISSQAFETNAKFNRIFHDMVTGIDPNFKTRDGGTVTYTPFNSSYVRGHSGWTNPDIKTQSANIPTIDSSIISKLLTNIPGVDNTMINDITNQLQSFIRKPNDNNPLILSGISKYINDKFKNTGYRTIVVGSNILVGESPSFKNKEVQFTIGNRTSRGIEFEVSIDGENFDGTLINGEMTLLGTTPVNSPAPQTTTTLSTQSFDELVEEILSDEGRWEITNPKARENLRTSLTQYKNNPSPEKMKEIQRNRTFKNVSKNFEKPVDNNIIQEEQQSCSVEFKIKFN